MAITSTQATKLNKSNRAAKDASLGTAIKNLQTYVGASGSLAVTSAQASASLVVVTTGLSAVSGLFASIRSSGSLKSLNAVSGSVAGTIVMAKDATVTGSAIAAGDIVTWIAF